jgi:hypothetical protein
MALERSERRLPQIDPSSLVGRADSEVVGPRATSALIDAFRSGLVTADDILQRTGELGKTKKKAELMSLQEQMSPEAQQARGLARQAQSAQNQQIVDTAGLAKQAKETELQAAIWKAQAAPGDYELKLNALTRAGISVPVSLEGGLNDAQRAQIDQEFADLSDYTTQQAMADQYIKGTDAKDLNLKHTDAAGNVIEEVRPGGMILGPDRQPISPEKFKQAVQYRQTPYNLWKAQGKNKFGNLFGAAGAVTAPAAPVDPAAAARARAQMVNAGMPSAQAVSIPDSQVVAPRSVSATKPVVSAASIPEVGSITPGGGIVTTTKEAGLDATKPLHETQVRALNSIARATSANQVLTNLEAKGFDPTSTVTQARLAAYQSGTLGQLVAKLGQITPDEQAWSSAVNNWSQGILRAESGAAITPKEQAWYERTFFPVLGDSPEVQQQKKGFRKAIESSMQQVISGQMTPTQYEAWREQLTPTPSASVATSGIGPVVNIPGVGKVQKLSNGQYRRVP